MDTENTGNARVRHAIDKVKSAHWAARLLKEDPKSWVIFDTETTGLGDAEIVQVGLCYGDGTIALDTLVRPCWAGLPITGIPADATAIHGITDEMVADAPPLSEVLHDMAAIMHSRTVIVYNLAYDYRILDGCIRRRQGGDRAMSWMKSPHGWQCAMLPYAEFIGAPGRNGQYRWQKLEGGDHTAIGDCRATLAVIQRMAAFMKEDSEL